MSSLRFVRPRERDGNARSSHTPPRISPVRPGGARIIASTVGIAQKSTPCLPRALAAQGNARQRGRPSQRGRSIPLTGRQRFRPHGCADQFKERERNTWVTSWARPRKPSACRTSILRSVKAGRISAGRDQFGQWAIKPYELHRVYPAVTDDAGTGEPYGGTSRNWG
jgi:hypothetical protein